jgi:hypothetical protein
MISPQTRVRLEDIASRIATGEEVSFEEASFIQKWATHNRHAYEILEKARRRAISGEPEPGSMNELVDGMNLGFSDPERLTSLRRHPGCEMTDCYCHGDHRIIANYKITKL